MASYGKYCRDQAAYCARRVQLASSADVAAKYRMLARGWLTLAEKATVANTMFSSEAATIAARQTGVRPQRLSRKPNNETRSADSI